MKQYIVDAFTSQPFSGNPAAVCVMDSWPSEESMMKLAMENNLSETAFIVKEAEGYHLRWFTPGTEVELCGHATLASAFVILNFYGPDSDVVQFSTLSGILTIRRKGSLYEMDFPTYELKEIPVTDAMERAFGIRPIKAVLGLDLVCVFETEEQVRNMTPDQALLQTIEGRIQNATARGTETDCVSRSFCPKLAISEDPVCGSAHCQIADYWSRALGKKQIRAYHESEGHAKADSIQVQRFEDADRQRSGLGDIRCRQDVRSTLRYQRERGYGHASLQEWRYKAVPVHPAKADSPEKEGDNLMATVTKIPATVSRYTATPIQTRVRRKVAAYARVSTDHEDQLNSYEAQCDYYTNYIQANDEWEFVGVYSDEGISGTSTRRRDGFNRMVEDALAGRIGLILTKSVSRFARNTVDSLTTIRKLKEHGTEVYFEKENIWTFDSKGELLLTIMSSLAQEESRSISLNVTWGQRKRFADGKATAPFSVFLGYDRGEHGEFVINPEQAEIVKIIYGEFLKGFSFKAIARKLTEMGIKSPKGKDVWNESTVKSILTNEKYKGCALLQKHYTADYLTKKIVRNDGAVPQYYVEDCHEAIIDPATFDRVQEMIEQRSKVRHFSGATIFSTKIRCGECGGWFGSKVWHSTDPYRKVIWRCNIKYGGKSTGCKTPHVTEEEVKAAFVRVINKLIGDRTALLTDLRAVQETYSGTDELSQRLHELDDRLNSEAEAVQGLIAQNARVAQNQDDYNAAYDAAVSRYEATKAEREKVAADIRQRGIRRREFERFIAELKKMPEAVSEFDETLWGSLVDYVTVGKDKSMVFTLIGGTELTP